MLVQIGDASGFTQPGFARVISRERLLVAADLVQQAALFQIFAGAQGHGAFADVVQQCQCRRRITLTPQNHGAQQLHAGIIRGQCLSAVQQLQGRIQIAVRFFQTRETQKRMHDIGGRAQRLLIQGARLRHLALIFQAQCQIAQHRRVAATRQRQGTQIMIFGKSRTI